MRALVTGCAGFIGSHLTEALLAGGHEVVGVDCFNDNYQRPQKLRNLDHQAKDWDRFEFVPIDLSLGDLDDLVSGCDVVFHLAAEPGVRMSWGTRFDRYVRNNIVATQHLLDALHTVSLRYFTVYGPRQRPDMAVQPLLRSRPAQRQRDRLRRRLPDARLHLRRSVGVKEKSRLL